MWHIGACLERSAAKTPFNTHLITHFYAIPLALFYFEIPIPKFLYLNSYTSSPQRKFIEARCAERGLDNLSVITADMNDFSTDQRFDRVVSVEMFEHMRNYQALLARIARWLQAEGQLFVHVFSHREYAYPFETEGDDNWMGRYFFTGGLMPSRALLSHFQGDLNVQQEWHINGRHYQRTCEAWLHNQDQHRAEIMTIFETTYGADAARWFQRWRVFFIASAELFGYRAGEEWGVSHYSLKAN